MSETVEVRDYTGLKTKDIVVEMLTENTGSHFLDSGGAYGRNWQRNQGKDFDLQPSCWWDWSVWRKQGEDGPGQASVCATVSLYHWMVGCLKFEPDLQAELDQFARENPEENWLWIQEGFADKLHDEGRLEEKPKTFNTYNDPDYIDLSQVLQYVDLQLEGEYEVSHMIVSVHGGCDVRGGYSSPKVFSLRKEHYEIWDCARLTSVATEKSDCSWYGDDPCMSSLQSNGETFGIEDPFKLPAWDIDWLEFPELTDIDEAITRASRIPENLQGTELPTEKQEELSESSKRVLAELEAERISIAQNYLVEQGQACLLLADKSLYLINPESDHPIDTIILYPSF